MCMYGIICKAHWYDYSYEMRYIRTLYYYILLYKDRYRDGIRIHMLWLLCNHFNAALCNHVNNLIYMYMIHLLIWYFFKNLKKKHCSVTVYYWLVLDDKRCFDDVLINIHVFWWPFNSHSLTLYVHWNPGQGQVHGHTGVTMQKEI